ncbi:MAG: serine/threonine protein kinase [Chloroflexi bacterium]|nr:MAG: serine/threonine protein kinase [Chloroflexota bacterium]MBL1196381.1 serine/threonine protein kinase [Chloroflexota bacterium]NOH13676.1 serine/threonine protein kinase [Chloroflexota bacterium]
MTQEQPALPRLNDRYQLQEVIGRGGMAEVFKGRDLMLERDVAIKVLRRDYSSDPAFRERFRQEAKAAANLTHPNIVTVHDFGFDEDQLFIVMEYVPGKDLFSMINDLGRFKLGTGVELMVQASAGIGYAHRAGLVHCDVKPHNFIVTPDKRLKVTDFGIARALASINPNEQEEVVWGSPQYFSPEQAGGNAPSPSSDVYSLGVVMYHMFTGQLPFNADKPEELARLHRRAKPIAPAEINPFIPDTLNEIILKVLAKEPSARYRTADQLGRVLLTFSKEESQAVQAQPNNGPAAPVQAPPPISRPISQPVPESGPQAVTYTPEEPVAVRPGIDWLAVGLGLLATLMVGGLIPFWMWVYFVFNPPIRP